MSSDYAGTRYLAMTPWLSCPEIPKSPYESPKPLQTPVKHPGRDPHRVACQTEGSRAGRESRDDDVRSGHVLEAAVGGDQPKAKRDRQLDVQGIDEP